MAIRSSMKKRPLNEGSTALPSAVVVSGAGGGGIGSEIAATILSAGHEVFCLERTNVGKEYLVGRLGVAASNIVVGDVSSEDCVDELARSFGARGQRLMAVVHNAARGSRYCGTESIDISDFRSDLDDIIIGAALMAKHFTPFLKASAPSSIVLISSSAAVRGAWGRGHSYAAAKAGLHGLCKQLALDLATYGITCNIVVPYQTLTPRVLRNGRRTADEIVERAKMHVPLGRPAYPADIAAAVGFLIGAGARYMTGQELVLDGGQSLAPRWTEPDK